ncbi:hypothetical protein Sste5346_006041 [Sporothrix stenoceras]|uniref:Ankyrin repeat protein n=1 Tax=Sporothrix stenoceras TaxID=5173 RepID=A0ABR3Z2G7_9PEZI
MVSTEKLYKNRKGFHLEDSDMYYYLDDGSNSHDRPAFYAFWSSMSLAKAAKKRLEKEKKQRLKQQAAEQDPSRPQRPSKGAKRKSKGKTLEDWTQAPASKEDLLAAIDRKDYLTIVTMLMSDMSLNDMLEDGTFVLSHAVDEDNAALVSILAMCGADPNVRHSSGNTPLHFAANTNCVAPAMLLLEIGAEVDVRDAHGLTPLHVACRERNLSVVLQLLAHGADPNLCDNRGLTPMSYALLHPKRSTILREMLTTLLTYGARTTGRDMLLPPFIEAILRYDSALMCRYLQAHPEVLEAEMEVATTGPDGGIVKLRPLYAAILIGNIYAIDQLLRRGADVHHVTPVYGKTITYLGLAVQGDSTPIVARLLLSNADPNVANVHGRTPLHLAAASQHGEVEVVELLLRHGADVQAQTHDRHSQPLHMAVRNGRADICFHLLKMGAQVDQPLKSGVTPIMLAVYFSNKSMLRFLMSNGGDVRYKTPQFGETAMHTACRVGNVSLAMLLLQQGLSVDASNPFPTTKATETGEAGKSEKTAGSDKEGTASASASSSASSSSAAPTTSRSRLGYAPIHAAASRGHMDIVRWLLANGADPTARIGRTAARICLSKDKAKNRASRRERERERERTTDGHQSSGVKSASYAKYDVDVEAADTTSATPVADDQPDYDSDSDPGETPIEVARAYGHERTAGLIEDAILAATPAAKEFLSTPAASHSSSSSANPSSSDPSPPGPSGLPRRLSSGSKPTSQYSLDPVYDSADEGEALAGELRKGKKVQPSPPPLDEASGGNSNN